MGILKKKRQLQKQKSLVGKKREIIIGKKVYINPKGNEYQRFFRSGKWINDNTGCREDPDWYRIIRKPNSGEVHWKHFPNSWCIRHRARKQKLMKSK